LNEKTGFYKEEWLLRVEVII